MREMKKVVLSHLSSHTRSKIALKDLARAVKVSGKEQFSALRQVIEQLKREGIVAADERGRLGYVTERKRAKEPTSRNVIAPVTITRRGMGIVRPEGWTEEIQIGPRSLRTALPGDVVEVIPFARPRKHKPGEPIEGEVLRVVSRTITRITGRMDVRRDFAFVVPDDRRMPRDIFLSPAEARKAKPGDKVVVELLPWEDAGLNPEGTVVEVLGPSGDARVEVLSVARSFGLPADFPHAVEAEAASLPGSIPAQEIAARMDLRAATTFTIDPEDARDFDDALSCEVMPDGRYRLGVHIADVSHYVREGTELDREAYARGTSVYLVNEVIPMLPEKLSNDLCSLRPREDRLTYSVLMEITPEGKVDDVRFARTVIHSKRRCSDEEAQQIQGEKPPAEPAKGGAAETPADTGLRRPRITDSKDDPGLREIPADSASVDSTAADSTAAAPAARKADPMLLVKHVVGLLSRLDPVKSRIDIDRRNSFDRLYDRADLLYQMGFSTTSGTDGALGGADSDPLRQTDRIGLNLRTGVNITSNLSANINFNSSKRKDESDSRVTETEEITWPDINLNWKGLHNWGLLKKHIKSSDMTISYIERTSKRAGSETEGYQFNPSWNMAWFNSLASTISLSYAKKTTMERNQELWDKSWSVNLELKYDVKGKQGIGLPLPFLRSRKLKFDSNLNTSVNIVYTNTEKYNVPPTTSISVAPRLTYTFSRNVSGNLTMNYRRTAGGIYGYVNHEVGMHATAEFKF